MIYGRGFMPGVDGWTEERYAMRKWPITFVHFHENNNSNNLDYIGGPPTRSFSLLCVLEWIGG